MTKKIRVAVLFGGKSAEHEVSLRSAKNIIEAIDKNKYEVVLIGIDKQGRWLLENKSSLLEPAEKQKSLGAKKPESVALIPQSEGRVANFSKTDSDTSIDVVFPVLHGTFGEDGTVQGLLKLANIPFVGAGVLGSAVGMDKDVMKRLLREAKIPTAKSLVFRRGETTPNFQKVKKYLGLPMFVKPANMGSSVGISKVRDEKEFKKAVKDAFLYDHKIIIEEFIKGREIECSVLGNEKPKASLPGEIIPILEFYSYDAKYLDENGTRLEIPAKLPKPIIKKVQELAVKTFKVLECEGFGRVDMFLAKSGKIYVNEINTIPGFTSISMYPKLWEASGLSYQDLIDKLIQLALEKFAKEQKLKTSFAN